MKKISWAARSWPPALALRSRHGAALCKSGEHAAAEAGLAEVIARRSATTSPGDPILVHARRWHLHALGRMGRLADAAGSLAAMTSGDDLLRRFKHAHHEGHLPGEVGLPVLG